MTAPRDPQVDTDPRPATDAEKIAAGDFHPRPPRVHSDDGRPRPDILNPHERMRVERGWPTPMSMRHAADALDMLVIPRYGDVLRWFADLCDEEPTR